MKIHVPTSLVTHTKRVNQRKGSQNKMPPSFSRHSKRVPLPPNTRVTKQSALLYLIRVPTAQGKWPKKIPVRENVMNMCIVLVTCFNVLISDPWCQMGELSQCEFY